MNYTEKVLDTLAHNGIKAGFFIQTGNKNRGNNPIGRTLVARISREGHTVGIHTGGVTDHELHTSAEAAGRLGPELEAGKEYIAEQTGRDPLFVRPPYGKYDANVSATYRSTNLTMLKWDIDGDADAESLQDLQDNFDWGMWWPGLWDWEGQKIPPKIVILYHDIRRNTADNVGGMIDYITRYTTSRGKNARFEAP